VPPLHRLPQVQTANAARVAAQQESHELRLKMRETDGEFTSDGKRCASCCSALLPPKMNMLASAAVGFSLASGASGAVAVMQPWGNGAACVTLCYRDVVAHVAIVSRDCSRLLCG
jgi:hypothetical protein